MNAPQRSLVDCYLKPKESRAVAKLSHNSQQVGSKTRFKALGLSLETIFSVWRELSMWSFVQVCLPFQNNIKIIEPRIPEIKFCSDQGHRIC